MISNESLAIFIKIISAANAYFALPIKWDSTLKLMVMNRTWRHKLFPFILTFGYCIVVGYSGYKYTVKSQADLIVVLFIWLALTGPFYILFWLNWNSRSLVSVFNGFLCLDSVQIEMLEVQEVTKDGLEVYLNCLWRLLQLLWMVFPFHCYIFIETETSIGEVWQFECTFLKFTGIAGITGLFSIGALALAITTSSIIVFANILSKWLKKLSRIYCGVEKKQQLKIIYRAINLLHSTFTECYTLNQFVPVLTSIAYVGMIACFFVAFRSNNIVFCVIVFVIGSAISGAVNIIFALAYNITKFSAEFLHNFEMSRNRGRDAAEDRRFIKSCRPIYTYIGEYSRISRNMFPSVMHEIIINATISLLLAVPS